MNMYSSLAKHFMHLCTPPRGPEMRSLFFQQLPPDIEYCLRAIFNLQRRNELNSKGEWKWIWFSASLLMIKVHDLRKWKKLNLFLRFFSACRQWYHHLSRETKIPQRTIQQSTIRLLTLSSTTSILRSDLLSNPSSYVLSNYLLPLSLRR